MTNLLIIVLSYLFISSGHRRGHQGLTHRVTQPEPQVADMGGTLVGGLPGYNTESLAMEHSG